MKSISISDLDDLSAKRLKILTVPDPLLKKISQPVLPEEFNNELITFIKDMLFTMYKAPGIGLAAPQVGVHKRIFVIDVDYERNESALADGRIDYEYTNFNPLIFINPIIKNRNGETQSEEGCLSLPEIFEPVSRAEEIEVEYQNLDGSFNTLSTAELLSICIQHENDHLDGIVFLDRLSSLKKQFFMNKLIKRKKNSK